MSPKYKLGGFSISSSVKPDELATKVKALMLMASSVVIYLLAKWFEITLTPDGYLALVTEISTLIGSIWGVYGIIQHLVAKIAEVKAQQNKTGAGGGIA